jgi:hypothetical protein
MEPSVDIEREILRHQLSFLRESYSIKWITSFIAQGLGREQHLTAKVNAPGIAAENSRKGLRTSRVAASPAGLIGSDQAVFSLKFEFCQPLAKFVTGLFFYGAA